MLYINNTTNINDIAEIWIGPSNKFKEAECHIKNILRESGLSHNQIEQIKIEQSKTVYRG
jgi:predicted TPR repeat methyltransferase